jgi:hypothetical protein
MMDAPAPAGWSAADTRAAANFECRTKSEFGALRSTTGISVRCRSAQAACIAASCGGATAANSPALLDRMTEVVANGPTCLFMTHGLKPLGPRRGLWRSAAP